MRFFIEAMLIAQVSVHLFNTMQRNGSGFWRNRVQAIFLEANVARNPDILKIS